MARFGFWARGNQSENSDVDVLVEVDSSIGLDFVNLADDLEKTLGLKADLTSSRAIKPTVLKLIEKEAIDA